MEQIQVEFEQLAYPTGEYPQWVERMAKLAAETFVKLPIVSLATPIDVLCRGTSGAMIAIMFAHYLKDYRVLIRQIRKPHEESHSSGYVCLASDSIVVFIDDHMQSGETLNAVYEKMRASKPERDVDVLILGHGWREDKRLKFTPKYLIQNRNYY